MNISERLEPIEHISAPSQMKLTPNQLELIRDMNPGLTKREYDQFIESSRLLGLNPLKRQICAVVVNDRGRGPRQFMILTTIAGLRTIADRSGTYRPDIVPARITYDEGVKNAQSNPEGIVDCIVTPFRFSRGRWHRIVGQVWWDEIAPIRKHDDGTVYLDSRTPWLHRPRGQIIKCAEAAALRAGWPENLANIYAEDEFDRARAIEPSPSDVVDQAQKDRLIERSLPRGSILVDMWDGNGLSAIPIGQFHDRVSEFIRCHREGRSEDILLWKDQQRIAFRQFFVHDKNAALDLKRQMEEIVAKAAEVAGEVGHG